MSTPSDAPDWRGMSQQDRDLGLNNGVAVAGSGDMVAGWERRSAEMRAQYSDHLDLRYGPRDRNRIDFFKAAEKGPTLLFIHGGYWQMRAKEVFAIFAGGPMAHGINVAMIGYTLEPDRGVRLVRRWTSDLDGAGASPRESRHGDIRHLRPRADPPQLSQRQARPR